jgi:hypothetical protein
MIKLFARVDAGRAYAASAPASAPHKDNRLNGCGAATRRARSRRLACHWRQGVTEGRLECYWRMEPTNETEASGPAFMIVTPCFGG